MSNIHPDIVNLVDQMRAAARRWVLVMPPGHAPRAILAYWLQQQTVLPAGGTGLLVTPSVDMMAWRKLGWTGPTLATSQFMKSEFAPELPAAVSIAVGQLPEYPEKFLSHFERLLGFDGDYCMIAVHENAPQRLADICRVAGFKVMAPKIVE